MAVPLMHFQRHRATVSLHFLCIPLMVIPMLPGIGSALIFFVSRRMDILDVAGSGSAFCISLYPMLLLERCGRRNSDSATSSWCRLGTYPFQ
ncbi:hypothetical protein BDP55DRAFT_688559 [Colletotrichum godetiae]|uniref:Uncharacterized protein n=1 Tax=Colletotrichum godetiae TaxID=1209918 RepID=A0AAJ0EPL5_9PEZI|nr:uncharacterized protein BDP55DRAFT_688559 [Colletotrichum godetiae]KAK1656598.1 hypothetical protein BDP55DRAFT_688559 [Colletotrichum godetiae]